MKLDGIKNGGTATYDAKNGNFSGYAQDNRKTNYNNYVHVQSFES